MLARRLRFLRRRFSQAGRSSRGTDAPCGRAWLRPCRASEPTVDPTKPNPVTKKELLRGTILQQIKSELTNETKGHLDLLLHRPGVSALHKGPDGLSRNVEGRDRLILARSADWDEMRNRIRGQRAW